MTPIDPSRPDQPADTSGLVGIDDIRAAARDLAGITLRTPLVGWGPPTPGDAQGHPRTWLKAESLQPIGAFKLRGAYHAVASLPAEARARGVVAHSSGNHAQGVARAARLFGVEAVIVMPDDAPAVKVAGVRADGAEIVFVSAASDERVATAERLARERGLTLIPAYDDAHVIAGQGTCGLEVVEQLSELGHAAEPLTVVMPIGGGGLASGVATAVKALHPDARVIGVEPELAGDAQESLRAGHIVRWEAERVGRTIADGQRTSSLGPLTFRHLSARLDDIVTVSEDAIRRAVARAARQARLVVEPSGATSIAALELIERRPGEHVVAIVSGGNVDPDAFAELLAAGG